MATRSDVKHDRATSTSQDQSDDRLRLILENLIDYAIFTTDVDGTITSWNSGAQNVLGYEDNEILGRSIDLIFTAEDREAGVPRLEMQTALEKGGAADNRWHQRKDGSLFWANGTLAPLRTENGEVRGYVKLLRDQTKAKRSREQLKARAAQQQTVAAFGLKALTERDLNALFDVAVDLLAQTLDVELCKVLRLLPGGEEFVIEAGAGWKPGLIGNARVPANTESQAGYTLLADTPVVVDDLHRETRFTGPPLLHDHGVVSGMSVIIEGPNDEPWGVLGVHTPNQREFSHDDVNFLQAMANTLSSAIYRNESERRLRQLNETLEDRIARRTADVQRRAKQLQSLSAELTQAEQRERRRLAEVLHDHLQQLLAASKMQAGLIRSRLRDAEQLSGMDRLIDLLEQSIAATRDLTLELSPPVLAESGLHSALDWLSQWMHEKHHLTVHVDAEQEVTLEDEDLRTLAFQAVRELLFNAIKHARVAEAWIRMRPVNHDRLEIVVRDEGAGFDSAAECVNEGRDGFGLFNIRERLNLLGGTLDIASQLGRGTTVTMLLPLKRPAKTIGDR